MTPVAATRSCTSASRGDRRAAGTRDVSLRTAVRRLVASTRVGNWWLSKIPPLTIVAYAEMARHATAPGAALRAFAAILASLCVVAWYAHVVNDLTDREEDLRGDKANRMAGVPTVQGVTLALALAGTALAIPGAHESVGRRDARLDRGGPAGIHAVLGPTDTAEGDAAGGRLWGMQLERIHCPRCGRSLLPWALPGGSYRTPRARDVRGDVVHLCGIAEHSGAPVRRRRCGPRRRIQDDRQQSVARVAAGAGRRA